MSWFDGRMAPIAGGGALIREDAPRKVEAARVCTQRIFQYWQRREAMLNINEGYLR